MDSGQLQNAVNLKSKIASLYGYMSRRLKIKQAPKLVLTNDQNNAVQPFGFTGHYDHQKRAIKVYVTNRHPTDILRSFAHEVIHHWQNEHNQLANHEGGGHYAQSDQQMRKKEMEAYLLGNIIFRDWQDEQRHGPPKAEPFLVSLNESFLPDNKSNLKHLVKEMAKKLVVERIITACRRGFSTNLIESTDFIEEFSNKLSEELEGKKEVACKGCGRGCDYANINEVSMGLIRCPNCNQKMDQEGNVYGG